MATATAPISEDEVRERIARYLEDGFHMDPGEFSFLAGMSLGNADQLDPFEAVVANDHITDADFGVYCDLVRAGLAARSDRVEDAIKAVWTEAATDAMNRWLAEHPWAPIATT